MLNSKRFCGVGMVVVLVMVLGLALAACVPPELTTAVSKTNADVASLKNDVAALSKKVDDVGKLVPEPNQFERETKDQVIRGRADMLDYRMTYDTFTKAVLGVPLVKGASGKPDVPAKPGVVESQLTAQLSKLQQALAGAPAQKGAAGKPDVPAKAGLLASKADLDSLTKQIADLKTQLDRIEKALVPAAAPAAK